MKTILFLLCLFVSYISECHSTPGGLLDGLDRSLVSISHGGPLVKIDCLQFGATRSLCAAGGPSYCPPKWLNQTNVNRCGISSVSHFVTSGNLAGTCCYTNDDTLPPFHTPEPKSLVAAVFGQNNAADVAASVRHRPPPPPPQNNNELAPAFMSTTTTSTAAPTTVPQNSNVIPIFYQPLQQQLQQQQYLPTFVGNSQQQQHALVVQPGDSNYQTILDSLKNLPQFQSLLSGGGVMKRPGILSFSNNNKVDTTTTTPTTTTTTTTTTANPNMPSNLAGSPLASPAFITGPFSFLNQLINPTSLAALFSNARLAGGGGGAAPAAQTPSTTTTTTTTAAPPQQQTLSQLQTQAIIGEKDRQKQQLLLQNAALLLDRQRLMQQLLAQQTRIDGNDNAEPAEVGTVPNPPRTYNAPPPPESSLPSAPPRPIPPPRQLPPPPHPVSDDSNSKDNQINKESDTMLIPSPDSQPRSRKPQQEIFINITTSAVSPAKDADNAPSVQQHCGIPKHFYRVARKSGKSREARIAGGQFSQSGEVCWAVALLDNGNYFAGGVLVGNRFVLTAAHEITDRKARQIVVRLGDVNLKSDVGDHNCAQTRAVRRVHVSPIFDASSLSGDLALLELDDAAVLDGNCVCTACLRSTLPGEGEWCVVAGYGSTAAVSPAGTKSEREAAYKSNANSEQLKHVPLPVVGNDVCQRALRDEQIAPLMPLPFGVLDNTQMCAGGIGDQDACYGDGGSPLACFDRDSFYVAGVVSYGRGCAEKMLPGVYASVPAQLDWILGVINPNNEA